MAAHYYLNVECCFWEKYTVVEWVWEAPAMVLVYLEVKGLTVALSCQ